MYMNDGNKTKINLRNKSVFITGVAGFIGSNLAKRLLSTVDLCYPPILFATPFVGQNRASKSHLHITLRISRFLQFINK